MRLKKLLAMVLTSIMALTTSAATIASAEAVTAAPDKFSGVGSYMGFFQVQTSTWVYRNNFEDKGAGFGTDIFKTVYNNETKAATTTEIQDTVIDGDGDYRIALKNISLEGSTDFNMVAISTNIPLDSGITITAATLKYGNKTITSKPVQKTDNKNFVHMMLINQYDNTMKDTVNTMVPSDGTDMTIDFTVSGFGYAKTITDAPTPTPAATATPVATAAPVASEDADGSGLSTGLIIAIIAGVVVVAGIIVIVVKSKKK